MYTVTILGIGRAGGALAIALDRAGTAPDRLIVRTRPQIPHGIGTEQVRFDDVTSIESDVLVIATADPEIRGAAERVAELSGLPSVALHLSGSLSSAVLASLKAKGVAVGSMHPLVSISDPVLGAERFPGAYFCVEGDPAAVEAAANLVRALGGNPFTIDTAFKPLYHASAVMASGNVTALFDAAVEMLSKCGLERSQAHGVLFPLLESAVANLSTQSAEDALTGPFVRGDVDAFNRHLNSFEGMVPDEVREIYLLLAERSAEIARRTRAVRADDPLVEAISVAKRKTGC